MLSLKEDDLWQEIKDAQALRAKHLVMWHKITRRRAGRYWQENFCEEATPENQIHQFVSFLAPQLVYQNPTVSVRPTRMVSDMPVAEAMEVALQHWMKEINVRQIIREVVEDAVQGWGIWKIGLEFRGDYDVGGLDAVGGDFELRPMWPFLKRVSPARFLIDAQATSIREARLIGEEFERDKSDLMMDDRYPDKEAIQALSADPDQERNGEKPSADRDRVRLYELYLPEHGRLVTLAENGSSGVTILRNEPWYGPDEGPFVLLGLYRVADHPYPLSPIMATFEQFEELNDHATAAASAAASQKKFGLYDVGNTDLGTTVKNAQPGHIYGVPNLSQYSFKEVELGGASPQQLEYVALMRDRLDRNMGFTDAQRGLAAGKTATEATITQANSDIRVDDARVKVADALKLVFRGIGWYFFNESSIVFNFVADDPVTGQPRQGLFMGGAWEGGQHPFTGEFIPPIAAGDYADYAFEIDPMSMARMDDALIAKRATELLGLVTSTIAPMFGPQVVNWRRLFDMYGKALQIQDLSEIVFVDPSLLMPDPNAAPPGMPAGQLGALYGPQLGTPNARPRGRQPGPMGMGGQPAMPMGGGMLGPGPQAGQAALPGVLNGAMAGMT